MNTTDKIRCCSSHVHYPTPVLFTLKYRGHEYWCPHCGNKYEFFDRFSYYQNTESLQKRKELFEKAAMSFLSDRAETFQFGQMPDLPPHELRANE